MGGADEQVSLSCCPLLTVTLKGRAVVIKWHVIAPSWGATKDSRDHPQETDTLGPCPLLLCQAFSPGLRRMGLEKGFRIPVCPPSPNHQVGAVSKLRSLC